MPEREPRPFTDALTPTESRHLLLHLLHRHPELVAEAEAFAEDMLSGVEPYEVAATVAEAIEAVSLDDLNERTGVHHGEHVDPTESCWQLLTEAVEPSWDEIERLVGLGLLDDAQATVEGVLIGLYGLRDREDHYVLASAPDFLSEAAATTLRRYERAATATGGRLDLDFVYELVPDWANDLDQK